MSYDPEEQDKFIYDNKAEKTGLEYACDLINSELNLKGLVYRAGQNIVLENIEPLESWIKKSAEEEEINVSPNDFIYQFDEKSEVEKYKNEYKKQKQ